MAGSKKDLLKNGVKRTGSSLFSGMQPLNARDEAEDEKQIKTVDIKKEENPTKTVNEKSETVPAVEEKTVEIKQEVETAVVESKAPEKKAEISEEIKEVKSEINKAKEVVQPKQDKTSRYEKDKFLLLDIRGYRDYVEHMAKAANMSATKYIRNLIQHDMDINMDIYEAHKALEEKLKGRTGN